MDQLAALPTLGMPVASFLVSASTLKVAPQTWPELSTLGTGFSSFKGCSKLLNPPEDVKKQPEREQQKQKKSAILSSHSQVTFEIKTSDIEPLWPKRTDRYPQETNLHAVTFNVETGEDDHKENLKKWAVNRFAKIHDARQHQRTKFLKFLGFGGEFITNVHSLQTRDSDNVNSSHIPLGNGAKDFPQPFFTISTSSERTRWPS